MTDPPFSSTLSTAGFLTLRNSGFRALRQVQGTSVVSRGWQRRPATSVRRMMNPQLLQGTVGVGTGTQVYYTRGALAAQQYLNEGAWFELEQITAAYNDARTQALARLRTAAREAGALAVVDVRIRRGRLAQALRTVE